MPIFSVIFVGILIRIFSRRQGIEERFFSLLALTLAITIQNFQGYFLKIGTTEIFSCAGISNAVLFFYSLYVLFFVRIGINRKVFYAGTLFLLSACVSILYEWLIPYDGLLIPDIEGYSWDSFLANKCTMIQYQPSLTSFWHGFSQIISFVCIAIVFKQLCTLSLLNKIFLQIVKWGRLSIFYGVFEFVMKNVFHQLTITYDFAAYFLGVNSQSVYTEAFTKGGTLYTLQGLTREPSQFIMYLFSIGLIIILSTALQKRSVLENQQKHVRKYRVSLACCFALMVLAGGFSAVWFLFLLLGSLVIVNVHMKSLSIRSVVWRYKKGVLAIALLFVVAVAVVYNNEYYYNRLSDTFYIVTVLLTTDNLYSVSFLGSGGSDGVGSTIARFFSIYCGTVVFLERPILGIGPGIQSIHDTTISLLQNYGIAGFFLMYRFMMTSKMGCKCQ